MVAEVGAVVDGLDQALPARELSVRETMESEDSQAAKTRAKAHQAVIEVERGAASGAA